VRRSQIDEMKIAEKLFTLQQDSGKMAAIRSAKSGVFISTKAEASL
jgi:hypothetical protein